MKRTLLAFVIVATVRLASAADIQTERPAEFARCVPADAKVIKLAGDLMFTEGPVWVKTGGYLVFSDIPKDELKKWSAAGGVTTFRSPSRNANGLAFSPDENKLYVADSGTPRHIRVFEVKADGTLGVGKVFCTIDKGGPDGIRVDQDGRVWSSAGDGVQVFGADGRLLGRILVPESPANLCFGGAEGKTLFITARKSLYSVRVAVTGAGR